MSSPPLLLALSREEQAEIISHFSQRLNIEPHVVEKDLWVCWALQQLFSMPNPLQMAFKGGTSLSKVFNVIFRFSEDIDITIDYTSFKNDLENPFAENVSKNAQKKLSENLKLQLTDYIHHTVKPYFQNAVKTQFDNAVSISVNPSGEKFWIKYPSAFSLNPYLKEGVLLEFGARNVTTPNEIHRVEPLLAKFIVNNELILPSISVPVLSPQRTFWEKATLIHVECNKYNNTITEIKANTHAERLSRHWYDLVMLHRHAIGQEAIRNLSLLEEVVKHKKVFFSGAHYNYDDCLQGKLSLIPDDNHIKALAQDYRIMITNGMFFETPPTFEEILTELDKIENLINRSLETFQDS